MMVALISADVSVAYIDFRCNIHKINTFIKNSSLDTFGRLPLTPYVLSIFIIKRWNVEILCNMRLYRLLQSRTLSSP